MYTLVFDTTGSGVGAALYRDLSRVAGIEKIEEFGQAEDLACNVEKMLKENKLKFGEIGLLGVCTGPGSFTGVRAGLAFARGLALGSPDLKLTGVSAFEVYANMLKESDRAFYNAVVIETKREDFYFQLFDENLKKNQRTAGFDARGNCQSPEEPPDQLYRRRGRAAAVGFHGAANQTG